MNIGFWDLLTKVNHRFDLLIWIIHFYLFWYLESDAKKIICSNFSLLSSDISLIAWWFQHYHQNQFWYFLIKVYNQFHLWSKSKLPRKFLTWNIKSFLFSVHFSSSKGRVTQSKKLQDTHLPSCLLHCSTAHNLSGNTTPYYQGWNNYQGE